MLTLFLLVAVFSPIFSLKENPKIIVVGCGPSGIAAATKLWKANFTNLKILEAEPRIGGRVNSVKFGDAYVDLGGEWCHGEKDNIVYNMVKQYNVLKHLNFTFKLIYSNGSYLDDDIIDNLIDFSESIDASLKNTEQGGSCVNLTSMGACFDKRFNTTLTKKYQHDPERLRVALEAVDWLKSYMVAYDSSPSLYDLSTKSDYKKCDGDLTLSWNGRGYKTILEVMMQKFPNPVEQLPLDSNIILNKEVSRITWNNNDNTRVSLRCSDNSSFEADHVIFTPSLGVLKANYRTLFEPALPEEKVKAIKTAGFGAILKIILHFPETWMNPHQIFGLVWSEEDRNKISSEFGKGPVKDGRSWLTTLSGIITGENNPKVLIIFFAGNMVPEIEKEDNRILSEGCVYMLRKFFGKNRTIPEPDDLMKSTWYSNPHFRGTYSYDSVEGNSVEFKFPEKLASPLTVRDGRPAVQFAGEATHPYYFSTVHGAIETGYREADRIIKFYAKE